MRLARALARISTAIIIVFGLGPASVANAEPPAPEAPAPEPQRSPPARPNVDIPATMKDSLVSVTTRRGPVEGKLTLIADDVIDIEAYNGQRISVERGDVLAIRPLFQPGDAPPPATGGWPRTAASPAPVPVAVPEPEPDASSKRDSELPPLSHEEEVAERVERARVSPWGLWGTIGVGPAWGQSTRQASPAVEISIDVAVAYHFVYLGTGMMVTTFGGASSFSNETTGGTLSSGAPASFGGYLEAGFAQGLFFPYSPTHAVEVRPGVAYGLVAMTDATQGIGNCVDCDSRSFPYNGAHYVRFQLGVFRAAHEETSLVNHVFMADNGLFLGGTVSFQEFVFGASPRLEHVLTFGLTCGWGR